MRPVFRAFRDEVAFPVVEVGPEESCELRRLAAIWASVDMPEHSMRKGENELRAFTN